MLNEQTNTPEKLIKLFEAAKTYREPFDVLWRECIKQDEADSNTGFVINDGTNDLYKELNIGVFVQVPHVKISNRRKVATLIGMEMFPSISTDVVDVPDYIEARERILRWGFRQSSAGVVSSMCARDLIAISNGVCQVRWVKARGRDFWHPLCVYKDPMNVYFDPMSRGINPNEDCRYIFECIDISPEEAELLWPGRSFIKMSDVSSPYQNKPETVRVIRAEWVAEDESIMQAIISDSTKEFLEPPSKTSIGMFSYCRMAMPPKRGHAYAEPDTVLEQILSNLSNLFTTVAIDSQLRTIAPNLLADTRDDKLRESLSKPGAFKPGNIIWHNGAYGKPSALEMPANAEALSMAQYLEDKAEGIASTPDVSRGVAPKNVRSGRGIGYLQEAASIPLSVYEEAVVNFGVQVGTVISRLCTVNIVDHRTLVSMSTDGRESTPVNLPAASLQGEKYFNDEKIPTYSSARVPELKDGQPTGMEISMSEDEAVEYAIQNQLGSGDIRVMLNDMSFGEFEVSVELRRKKSPEQRQADASFLHSIGAASPLHVLRESGVPNAEDVMRDMDSRNAQLKAGEIMLNNPLLMELAMNPQALAAIEFMFEKSAAETQQKPPTKKVEKEK